MKKIILLLLWCCAAFAQGVKPTGAWLPVHAKWEHVPATINPKLETGATTVLYFDEHGNFVAVAGVVNRELGRYTTISRGDGQVISIGEWDGHLPGRVRYRLISRTVSLEGEKLPGPWQEEALTSTAKGQLRFQGKLYRPVEGLGQSVRELLASASMTQ